MSYPPLGVDTFSIKLAKYTYSFRQLKWREEFEIKLLPKIPPIRVNLAHALTSISGLPVNSVVEAIKVLEAIPYPLLERVWRLYRASFPPTKKFYTMNLYKAPTVDQFIDRVEADEEEQEDQGEQ